MTRARRSRYRDPGRFGADVDRDSSRRTSAAVGRALRRSGPSHPAAGGAPVDPGAGARTMSPQGAGGLAGRCRTAHAMPRLQLEAARWMVRPPRCPSGGPRPAVAVGRDLGQAAGPADRPPGDPDRRPCYLRTQGARRRCWSPGLESAAPTECRKVCRRADCGTICTAGSMYLPGPGRLDGSVRHSTVLWPLDPTPRSGRPPTVTVFAWIAAPRCRARYDMRPGRPGGPRRQHGASDSPGCERARVARHPPFTAMTDHRRTCFGVAGTRR